MKTRIVIVGGGTAGWLTAGIIAARHCSTTHSAINSSANSSTSSGNSSSQQTDVILIESPEVKNLGVGEGTWPTMRDTLRQIGISERTFLSCCDASFKQSSKFVGWLTGNNEHYYHPFTAPAGYGSVNIADHWSASSKEQNFESWVCAQGAVCEQQLAPKTPHMSEYAFALNYGYHLNAGKFVEMLQQHCIEKLGVRYIQGHVAQVLSVENGNTEVENSETGVENGDIAALVLASGEQVDGDLFIDCSGFAGILIDKHYQVPFISKQHILFNDTALALQVEHASDEVPIASCTVATAQQNGWIWDIALQNRRGIGHVFSSDFSDTPQAEDALFKYVQNDPYLKQQTLSPRSIKFTPGHRATFWQRNCVAIGVSAGFVEPLEATALVLIEKSAEWLSQQLPRERSAMSVLAKRFNQLTLQRWEEIIDFLKLHYLLSKRQDSEYWRAHQLPETIPESLQDALSLWRSQAPGLYESNQRFELFSSASKQYVLYGMGFNTSQQQAVQLRQQEAALIKRLSNETLHNTEKLLSALPTNRQFLNGLKA